ISLKNEQAIESQYDQEPNLLPPLTFFRVPSLAQIAPPARQERARSSQLQGRRFVIQTDSPAVGAAGPYRLPGGAALATLPVPYNRFSLRTNGHRQHLTGPTNRAQSHRLPARDRSPIPKSCRALRQNPLPTATGADNWPARFRCSTYPAAQEHTSHRNQSG